MGDTAAVGTGGLSSLSGRVGGIPFGSSSGSGLTFDSDDPLSLILDSGYVEDCTVVEQDNHSLTVAIVTRTLHENTLQQSILLADGRQFLTCVGPTHRRGVGRSDWSSERCWFGDRRRRPAEQVGDRDRATSPPLWRCLPPCRCPMPKKLQLSGNCLGLDERQGVTVRVTVRCSCVAVHFWYGFGGSTEFGGTDLEHLRCRPRYRVQRVISSHRSRCWCDFRGWYCWAFHAT